MLRSLSCISLSVIISSIIFGFLFQVFIYFWFIFVRSIVFIDCLKESKHSPFRRRSLAIISTSRLSKNLFRSRSKNLFRLFDKDFSSSFLIILALFVRSSFISVSSRESYTFVIILIPTIVLYACYSSFGLSSQVSTQS